MAQDKSRWPLAGDQLVIDLDLSVANLPPGTRLAIGSAVIEVTAQPHTGCAKFIERFGADAHQFVNSPVGRELNLRGINAKVVQAGRIRVGDVVAKADPDGYTLLMQTVSSGAINFGLYGARMPHRPDDLAGVALVVKVPNAIFVNNNLPVRTLRELVDLAKRQPGKLNIGSSGVGTSLHMTGELLKQAAGIDLTHVPFRGAGPMIQEIIAGRVESGSVRVGDRVIFSPSNKTAIVASIERWAAPVPESAEAGRSVGITLDHQLFVDRGEIVSHLENPPDVGTAVRVNLFWLGKRPMEPSRTYKLKLATAQTETFTWREWREGYGAGDRYDRRTPPRPWRVSTSGGWSEPASASKFGRTSAPSRKRAVRLVGKKRTSLLYSATASM